MKEIEPETMLDTWEKWEGASVSERYYYAAYLQQKKENGKMVQYLFDDENKQWKDYPTCPYIPVRPDVISRLKPESELNPNNNHDIYRVIVS